MANPLSFLLFSVLLHAGMALVNVPNAIFGPAFPAPTNLANSVPVQQALQTISSTLQTAKTKSTEFGSIDYDTTSFSIDIYSTHDAQSLFTYHFSAPGLAPAAQGVTSVNSDTIYRLGSVSKLLTAYIYLIAIGDTSFNDPIAKYIPEFAAYAAQNKSKVEIEPFNYFDFESITIGALASHLGGIPHDLATPARDDALLTDAGWPTVPPVNASDCGSPAYPEVPCTREDAIANLLSTTPSFPPFYSPAYSNTAYTLLMYALENITAQAMPDLMSQYLIEPLELLSTSYYVPSNSSQSIIPFNDTISWYSFDLRDVTPAGGYYSSTNDLRKIGIAILSSTLLSTAQTRRWMKPVTLNNDPNEPVGAPWEIFRAPINRTSYMYTKGGDINLYGSLVVYLPDYDVGFTVLAAGLNFGLQPIVLGDIIVEYLLPALEQAAKDQAAAALVGTYVEPNTGSIVVLDVDEYSGLNITKWTVGNQSAYAGLEDVQISGPPDQETGRLYPAGFRSPDGTQTSWKAVYEDLSAETCSPGVFSAALCQAWYNVDSWLQGGISVDDWLITTDANGTGIIVSPRATRLNYHRQ